MLGLIRLFSRAWKQKRPPTGPVRQATIAVSGTWLALIPAFPAVRGG
ncbi:hypothetical protein [Streptomonospora wellingtoniae]|uniref:Uncharacterized protein n=1 Tax=Streptomonospora wellingtoniae TaxID=3075544 RepID=A0ABU2KZQ3_9ACTN|nr:hypothetical protein [Streptomonospora sp. DSM 45055]MDT0304743.1 hypothetical protein [Streptomonospora sp. DSM 45055]